MLLLCEYASPVWSRPSHASKFDPVLNDGCRAMRPTRVDDLYLLCGIFPHICQTGSLIPEYLSKKSKDIRSPRIDFVFDTYILIDNSVKDSERSRHSQSRVIEIISLAHATSRPIDMESFWSSSNNKTKFNTVGRRG